MKKITIAIDGHSSCGKSSIARHLAQSLGYIYIDTGAMYRAVTLHALRHGLMGKDGAVDLRGLRSEMESIQVSFRSTAVTLGGENVEKEIRGMDVSERVSLIAAIPFVREAMVEQQRALGKDKGVVMDGRDIGTTVFPDAELKVFVTARDEVRARRRYEELQAGAGAPAPTYEDVLANIRERDYIDSHREVSPLRRAEGSLLLDNSDMTIAQQDRWILDKALEIISGG